MKVQFKLVLFVVMVALLLVVTATYPEDVYADVTHCGTLGGSEAWAASDNVHIVTCDVTIPSGVTLTIEVGAIIKFQDDAQINVNGKLVAQGTFSNPIYFTSYRDDGIGGDTNGDGVASAPAKGDWGHIRFNSGSDDSSIISRAVIRYSGEDYYYDGIDDGAIFLSNASPELSYITFTDNYINGVEINNVSWNTDVWDNTTVVYVIEQGTWNGDLTIPALNTLTITPGMKIKLGYEDDIRIDGKLVAVGTTIDPIYFSSKKDDTLCGIGAFDEAICDTNSNGISGGTKGDWGHIRFNSGSDDSSIISRAVIRYSGQDYDYTGIDDGAIFLSNASPELSYITFTDNYINGVELDNVNWTTDTWDNTTIVYVIEQGTWNGDLTIPVLNTLTIVPGMKIKLGYEDDIRIDGKLVAVGTTIDPIYFSSKKDDTLCGIGAFDEAICDTNSNGISGGTKGDWGHIRFNSGSDDSSIISRAVIRYSGEDYYYDGIDDGAIFLSNASPELSYITFTDNYINGVELDNVNWTTDTWDNTTVVYVIEQGTWNGDLTIPALNTLTIVPGMKIKLGYEDDIRIDGKLVAVGTTIDPIYFSSKKDDTLCGVGAFDEAICDTNGDGAASAPAKGDWGHIRFNSGSDDSSIISRAVIRYSGQDYDYTGIDDGAIFLSNASPELSYITLTDNYINGVEINNISWTTDTWDNTTIVYVIEQGDMTIPALNTLTIVPGMKIKLSNDDSLNVDGKLVAVGTTIDPIYFSSKKDDAVCGIGAFDEAICDTNNNGPTIGSVGDWGNIQFNSGSDDTSLITRVVISFGGDGNIGAIRLVGASPTISYTQIVSNYRAIEALSDSTPTLVCNDIHNNTNFGIYNDNPTTPIVIAENHWWGDASGPTHSGNPGGTGQTVSGGVDYDPWQTFSCVNPPPPVSPPTNLQASAVSETQINLTWQDNSSDETEFHIERSPNGTTDWTEIATVGADVTSYNNTGLSCSITYYYRVRAHRHSDGQFSGYSNVDSATTYPCTPSNLSATAVSETQINLIWQDNSSDETEFHIERSPNGSTGWTEITTVGANVTNYSDTGLLSGTTYYYRVRAHRHSDSAYSGYSNVDDATTPAGPVISPSNLSATAVSETQINLTWQDNSSDETEFHIERSPNGTTGWTEIATVGADVTSYNNTGLSCSTTYYYRVRAHRHSDGQFSGYSNVDSATTYPCIPTYLSAMAVSETQINLTWQDNSSDETEFHIERSPNGTTDWTEIATVGPNATSYSDTGVISGTTYYYRIRTHRHSDDAYSGYSNVADSGQDYSIHLPIIMK